MIVFNAMHNVWGKNQNSSINGNLKNKSQFIALFAFSISEKIAIRNIAPSVGQAAISLPSAKRQTVKTT